MDIETATDIVKSLADGIDPHTGEVFATASPFQHPDTIRALYLAVVGLEAERERARRRASLPGNHGKPWTTEEDDRLVEGFDAGQPLGELGRAHGRTRGSIVARLTKLGKIEE